ncbi:MAG: BCLAF1 and THRAP3 family protein, partial [Rhodospirillales bacterium]|nr:BCLAF1 and THRAP3 family protein [Rhodospirillales bacterium]
MVGCGGEAFVRRFNSLGMRPTKAAWRSRSPKRSGSRPRSVSGPASRPRSRWSLAQIVALVALLVPAGARAGELPLVD